MNHNVIKFPDHNTPDADCEHTDDDGITTYPFQVTYSLHEKSFTFDIWATDFDDADDKLQQLKNTAKVTGQILHTEELTELD